MNPQKNQDPERLKRRYRKLAAALAKLGPVLHGTITERTLERPDSHNPGKTKTYGPYHQWTFKREGKTVTVNLTSSQAKRYQRALDNQRTLDRTTQEMRELSLQLLQATTKGVTPRKTKKHP